MRSIALLLILISAFNFANASSGKNITPTEHSFSVYDLSRMKVKEYELATGKHLNVIQKMVFKNRQNQLRKELKSHKSTFNGDPANGFNLAGFLLGAFLGPIGVGISYLLKGDEDIAQNRTHWAWRGFLFFLAMFVIIVRALIPVGA